MSAYILNNKKQNIFDIEKRHIVKINFNIDNNLAVSDYKVDSNEDKKTIDLKVENHLKDKTSKKRKNQKKSRDKIDMDNEKSPTLDENSSHSLDKKIKKEQKKLQPSKKKNNSKNENFDQDENPIETTSENISNLNQILDNEKKKSTKRSSRKTKSSAKIDIVNLDSEKNKVKTKKTGWWNN